LRGRLDGPLNKDGSATMSVWRDNGSIDSDTGEDIVVHASLLGFGQRIASGMPVVAAYLADSNRWYIVGVPPPGILRGTLTTTLSPGGSASMTVAGGGGTITVFDWLLQSGQTIANGSKVIVAGDLSDANYYVIAAACK
jgi:hypothetical protein